MGALSRGDRLVGRGRARVRRAIRGLTPVRGLALAVLLASAVLGRCAPAGPRPIVYGKESCAYCLMGVDDPRFGAELVTHAGKVRVFDSAECLAGYLREHPEDRASSAWVTDFARPRTLLRADQAHYRQTTAISSPMGLGVAAVAPGDVAPAALVGMDMSWTDVVALSAGREGDREAAR